MRKVLTCFTLLFLALPLSVSAAEVLNRDQFSLNRFAGAKIIYLDFWASWCVPCRHSFPWLNAMQEKYGKDGLVIVGINVDPERADADRFLEKYPANFTLVMDPNGELAEQWRLQGMPSAVIVNAEGEELHRHIGFRNDREQDYEALLQDLLHTSQDTSLNKAPQEQHLETH